MNWFKTTPVPEGVQWKVNTDVLDQLQADLDKQLVEMWKSTMIPAGPTPMSMVSVPADELARLRFMEQFLRINQPELYKTLSDGADAHVAMTKG